MKLIVTGSPHGSWVPWARRLFVDMEQGEACRLDEPSAASLDRLLVGDPALHVLVFIEVLHCRTSAVELASEPPRARLLAEWRTAASAIIRAVQESPERVLLVDVEEAASDPQALGELIRRRWGLSVASVPSIGRPAADPVGLALAMYELAADPRLESIWLEIHAMCMPLGPVGAERPRVDVEAAWSRLQALLKMEATPSVPREQMDLLEMQCRLLREELDASLLAQMAADRERHDAARRLSDSESLAERTRQERDEALRRLEDLRAERDLLGGRLWQLWRGPVDELRWSLPWTSPTRWLMVAARLSGKLRAPGRGMRWDKALADWSEGGGGELRLTIRGLVLGGRRLEELALRYRPYWSGPDALEALLPSDPQGARALSDWPRDSKGAPLQRAIIGHGARSWGWLEGDWAFIAALHGVLPAVLATAERQTPIPEAAVSALSATCTAWLREDDHFAQAVAWRSRIRRLIGGSREPA